MKTSQDQQVAAFGKLVGFCSAHGAMYKPVKESLTVTALNSLLTSAQQSLEAVNTLQTAYKTAVENRGDAFAGVPKLMTRVYHAFLSSTSNVGAQATAKAYLKHFRAARKKVNQTSTTSTDGAATTPTAPRRLSHLDLENRVKAFSAMLSIVTAEPSYVPKEAELTVDALSATLATLKALNAEVLRVYLELNTARKQRDVVLYSSTGLYGIAKGVKSYVLSTFGTGGPDFAEVHQLEFKSKP